jgi:hypothetical protein
MYQRLWFDQPEDGRLKTGRATLGTLARPTERLMEAYFAIYGFGLLPV